MNRAHGVDYSKYQISFTPADDPPRPLDFGVQRSSYGLKTDELFYELLPGTAALKRRLWYHYYSTGVDVKQQLEYSLNIIKNSGVKFHCFWADYEQYYNNLNANSYKDIVWMVKEMEQRAGIPCCLYTNPNNWNVYLEPFGSEHRSLKFAIAQYFYFPDPDKKSPVLPKNCQSWTFHQYGITGKYFDTENGLDYGSGHPNLDKDVFNGDVVALDEFLGLEQDEPTEPQPPAQTIDTAAIIEHAQAIINLATTEES